MSKLNVLADKADPFTEKYVEVSVSCENVRSTTAASVNTPEVTSVVFSTGYSY